MLAAKIGAQRLRPQASEPGMRRQGVGGDQVLAHLDKQVGEATAGGMMVHRVAGQRAIIGLVVPDREAKLAQRRHEGVRQARIGVPEHADFPRPRPALPGGREGMERDC